MWIATAVVGAAILIGCGGPSPSSLATSGGVGASTEPPATVGTAAPGTSPGATSDPVASDTPDPSIVTLSGAGDIGRCGTTGDEATGRLLDDLPGFVFTAGDNAYETGSARDFLRCYEPSWGRHLQRTYPAPGNHDHLTRGATGYFDYFGDRAGTPGEGWYAVDVGTWRLIVLDSECAAVGGCGRESRQGRWLARELTTNPRPCTLAIWHHPRFSTGDHGPNRGVSDFWDQLHEAGVDLIVNGHEHSYERFVPVDPSGRPDPGRGIRQIVVGTGGAPLRGFPRNDPNSEVRDGSSHGVLRLDLGPDGYSWAFLPVAGGVFEDAGSDTCHAA